MKSTANKIFKFILNQFMKERSSFRFNLSDAFGYSYNPEANPSPVKIINTLKNAN